MERPTIHEQAAPVQPAGYGAREADDPANVIAEQDAVRRTMAKLPEALRICLLLSVVGGLSSQEIANLLDMKEAAVRQRLARARKQFQQAYTHESGEEVFDTHTDTRQTNQDGAGQQTGDKPYRLSFAPRSH